MGCACGCLGVGGRGGGLLFGSLPVFFFCVGRMVGVGPVAFVLGVLFWLVWAVSAVCAGLCLFGCGGLVFFCRFRLWVYAGRVVFVGLSSCGVGRVLLLLWW